MSQNNRDAIANMLNKYRRAHPEQEETVVICADGHAVIRYSPHILLKETLVETEH